MKKLRKTFIREWIWVEFVQVHVRPNVSDPFPEKIVRERLDGAIRLLRGGSCSFSIQLSTGRKLFLQYPALYGEVVFDLVG